MSNIVVGKYRGVIADKYNIPKLLTLLENIPSLISDTESEVLSSGRNNNIKISLRVQDNSLNLVVKTFGRQYFIQDKIATIKGSKAERTWNAAYALSQKGIYTPPPVGFLEYWKNNRLLESYYISEYQNNIISFTDELIRLFQEDPDCEKFMLLMNCVADAIRIMHEAGFQHNDLGNQNILLSQQDDNLWGSIQFIDLNRMRIKERLSNRDRARDISRIYLPSDLLRIFKEMYWNGNKVPSDFKKWEMFYRKHYRIHTVTRKFRHPVRTVNNWKKEKNKLKYPSEKDMWIWDKRSVQPISVMKTEDRKRFYSTSKHIFIVKTVLSGVASVWREYKNLQKICYKTEISIKNKIGIAINPDQATIDRELALLEKLGKIPIIIRFYCHDTDKQLDYSADLIKDLYNKGYSIVVALAQNREAVTNIKRWRSFLSGVLERTSQYVDSFEVCHAINRVKWGIWDFKEYNSLLRNSADIAGKYSSINFIGPAVIDFDYPFLMAALKSMPKSMHFKALSHHLYVDRRGAPENRQGLFTALDKFMLARAIAHWAPGCNDKLIISEVNWPLKNTGVYSPVSSPYESPGPRFNDPSVDEDEYADYMIRYIITAICSGMVDCVYWWRLTARGFGLVDDTDNNNWRERPAFKILKYFLFLLGDSKFIKRILIKANSKYRNENAYLFIFKKNDGRKVCMGYSPFINIEGDIPFEYKYAVDAFGNDLPSGYSPVLSGRPIYFIS